MKNLYRIVAIGLLCGIALMCNNPKARHLTAKQTTAMTNALASNVGMVHTVYYCTGDQEGEEYADQLKSVFTDAHWTVGRVEDLPHVHCYGVRVFLHYVGSVPKEYMTLKQALVTTGISAEYEEQEIAAPAKTLIAIQVCHNHAK
jgi:hypothetical protein